MTQDAIADNNGISVTTADAIADSNGIPFIARSAATWQSRNMLSFNLTFLSA
jgi:hypothetical protein